MIKNNNPKEQLNHPIKATSKHYNEWENMFGPKNS